MTLARPVLVVGLPRSGTTWTLRVLGEATGAKAILEPDNEDKFPAAIHGKRAVGRYPVLRPGDEAAEYRDLWQWILAGAPEDRRALLARHLLGPGAVERIHEGKKDPVTWVAGQLARPPRSRRGQPQPAAPGVGGRVVAKSIHAQLAVEWLASEFDLDVVLLLRNPANVLASWLEVNLKDARNSTLESRHEIRARYLDPWQVPLPGPDPVEQVCWRIALLTAAIEDAASRHPEWHLRTHERLCLDPVAEFRQLYAALGLEWDDSVRVFLEEHDAPGSGFSVKRVASELPGSWKDRVDADQLAVLRGALDRFPITTWTDRDFAAS